jgi:hypothetical protein
MNVITVLQEWHTRILLTIRPGKQRPTDGDFFVLAPTELSDPATPLARILGIGLARRDAIGHAGSRPYRLAPWLAATILIASASHLMRAIGIPLWDALAVALNVILVLALALALLYIWSVDSLLLRLGARGVGWFKRWFPALLVMTWNVLYFSRHVGGVDARVTDLAVQISASALPLLLALEMAMAIVFIMGTRATLQAAVVRAGAEVEAARLALAARGEYAMLHRLTPDAVPHHGRPGLSGPRPDVSGWRPDASDGRPGTVRQVSPADQPLLPRVANELARDPGQSDTALARAVFGPGKDNGRYVQRARRLRRACQRFNSLL